ncbi:MAG: hypothetical protein ABL986_20190 [Vicinamibacterales bacterium]
MVRAVTRRVSVWALVLALASVYSVTCLAGALQMSAAHDACAGMAGTERPAVTTDCCAAGDIRAVTSGPAFALAAPVPMVIATINFDITDPLDVGQQVQSDASPPGRPTYLGISSFRI